MTLTRNQFFILLLIIVMLPFFARKLIWLATSKQTIGRMWYEGHGNFGSVLGLSSYSVIRYKAGKDSLYFNNNTFLDLEPGELIEVRYQRNNPSDAIANNFLSIWGQTIVYAFFPFLILLVIYLTPERLSPIIPRKSKILLGKKPFIKIIHG
ncbi:MAG TPA: DUF3592 domain-containing protein [Puia sp.]|nr:DUF3592 domain-containing protein [Puia sp.]